DLTLIQGKLRSTFPDASIQLSQLRDHIVLDGEARDPAQIARIYQTLSAYLASVFVQQGRTVTVGQTGQILQALGGGAAPLAAVGAGGLVGAGGAAPGAAAQPGGAGAQGIPTTPGIPGLPMLPGILGQPGAGGLGTMPSPLASYATSAELGGPSHLTSRGGQPQIINLMRVAGPQPVMLKVRIAELNRTALRRIGANFLGLDPHTGGIVGSIISGPENFQGTIGQIGNLIKGNQLFGAANMAQNGLNTTVFGIF